ncbi:hybrid-cluster NAD(P)-dependent oxidoreductase [Vibrio sp. 2-Bac 85]
MKYLTHQWKKRSAIILTISSLVCAALWLLTLTDWATEINAVPLPLNDTNENPMWVMIIVPFVKVAVFIIVPAFLCLRILWLIKFIGKLINGRSNNAESTSNNPIDTSNIALICEQRIQETHDTVTFCFKSPALEYHSGQYISIQVNVNGIITRRAYTLSSSPTRPENWMLTVKRVQEGKVSNYLHDKLQPGMQLQATSPRGQFNLIDATQSDDYVFISAGSGITPMIAMTRYLVDTQSPSQIHFIYFTRSVDDIIFADELKKLNEQHANINVDIILSDIPAKGYKTGLIRESLLNELIPKLSNHAVYTCGPAPFMNILEAYLIQQSFDMQHFYKESFGERSSHSIDTTNQNLFTISVPASNTSIEMSGCATLLDAIEEMNLPIIQDCRSGVCGSCKCQITKGNVESSSQVGLSDDDVAQGYVLACSTHLKSDVEISLV